MAVVTKGIFEKEAEIKEMKRLGIAAGKMVEWFEEIQVDENWTREIELVI